MKKILPTALMLIALSFLMTIGSPPGKVRAHILDVHSGRYTPFEEMITDLRQSQMVFIGELHDRMSHHQAQLQIIQALHEAGEPVAIALEMFRAENQAVLDRWVEGKIGEREFQGAWNRNWGMWEFYREILHYARQEGIPLVALNVPREITQQVARKGFDSLSAEQLDQVPGVACDVSPEYEAFIRRSLGAHAHAHGGMNFRFFCEAQMVWDTAMAHNLLEYVQSHPDQTVVVLAGSGHAWRHGIPEQVQRRQEVELRIVLPEVQGRWPAEGVTKDDTDYLLLGVEEGPLH